MTDEKPNARSMGYLLMDTRSQSDLEFSKSHVSYAVNSEITDVFLCVDFRKFLLWIKRKSSRWLIFRWRSLGKTICVLLRHINGCQRLQDFMESCSIPRDAWFTHTVLVLCTLSEDYLHSCRILKLDSKPDTMLMRKVCSFIGLAVLMATVVALSYASGFGKCFLMKFYLGCKYQ